MIWIVQYLLIGLLLLGCSAACRRGQMLFRGALWHVSEWLVSGALQLSEKGSRGVALAIKNCLAEAVLPQLAGRSEVAFCPAGRRTGRSQGWFPS